MTKVLIVLAFLVAFLELTHRVIANGMQPAGESINDTLNRVRARFGPKMTAEQFGALLNEVAWVHRAEGIVLLGKAGGSNCPTPNGARVSCDFLVNASNRHGWDVLSDAGEGGSGNVTGQSGDGEDLSGALASGARTLVAPVDPGGSGPGPVDPPSAPGAKGEKGDKGDRGEKGDKGDRGEVADVSAILARLAALEARVGVLESKPIPVSCSAGLNFGATRIPISCKLNP